MTTIQDFIDYVRQVLIKTNDTLARHEIYNRFVNECNAFKQTEDDFYKTVLTPAYKSIDWNAIEETNKHKLEKQNKLQEELLILLKK